jgi:hypothetical protein
MLSTRMLLVIIVILGSAVTLKAGVHYGRGMPGEYFVIDVPLP